MPCSRQDSQVDQELTVVYKLYIVYNVLQVANNIYFRPVLFVQVADLFADIL